ncbi:sensor histidine kinase [Pelagibacterium montanilacus]|uniref:sensor histidine kinase n=1 Tax=Pelagibacterium montanilacus TaxID=2185280 RepID=UPI000F8C5021|nr:HAMP domain-containing sensor histidine kinase [Pelagibacterium montanilacus]
MRLSSLGLRLTLLAIGGTLLGLALIGAVIALLLRDFVIETNEANLEATLVALMANSEYVAETQQVRVNAAVADSRFDQPFSGWYWQLAEAGEPLIRSGSLWQQSITMGPGEPLASGVARSFGTGPQGERLRILSRTFTGPGSTVPLTVAVTMPERDIDDRVRTIVLPLAASIALLGLVLALATIVQVRFGLAPLRRLSANLRAIKTGKTTRLPAEPIAEIAPVVDEMNALLEANRQTIARARTHVGNLAHGLKTPLTTLAAKSADPALPPETRETFTALSDRMNRLVSHHLRRARSAATLGLAGARTSIGQTLADLEPVLSGIYADKGITLEISAPADLDFAGEREDLDELLGNLLDNACKWADQRVVVTVAPAGEGRVAITVGDDGPGMSEEEAQTASQWGKRFDEGRPGAGLGLAIVADLAALYGGSLDLIAHGHPPLTGASAVLQLPALPSGQPERTKPSVSG